ncbi:MAG: LapD/MoxY N-terminal periplasmic domain-containing protein, partial [Pseudomonadales bacterium]
MTLYKQLWIAIVVLLSIIFLGSVFTSSMSAQQYMEKSVSGHNQNYANFLALLLNNDCAVEICDKAHLETWLKPPMDQGYISTIRLISPMDEVLFDDRAPEKPGSAPEWFKSMFPIAPTPGTVSIQAGWTPLGDLALTTPIETVYTELWEGSKKLTLLFLITTIIAGLLGNIALKRILSPLDAVVIQANALGERRFIKTPEPYTFEFKRVVVAMNALADRVKAMLEQEAETLNEYRQELQEDKVTKLLNRDHFMTVFKATLQRDDSTGAGAIAIMRITQLVQLNTTFGYQKVDAMLEDLGARIRWLVNINGGWTASRLNGSDFMVLAPALKQRSKIYVDGEDYFHIVPADRNKEPRGANGEAQARPSVHIQVLEEGQESAAESIKITQETDMGDVSYAGDGLFIYLSEISVEGVTTFKYEITLDGETTERAVQVTMASINDPMSVGRELQTESYSILEKHGMQDATELAVSAIYFNPLDPVGALMGALDAGLSISEEGSQSEIQVAYLGNGDAADAMQEMDEWRGIFKEAFDNDLFDLFTTPVAKLDGTLLHHEANLRLRRPHEVLNGGQFLPWITRLNMTEALDRLMVTLALDFIEEHGQPVAVKLSAEVIREPAFTVWFEQTLAA